MLTNLGTNTDAYAGRTSRAKHAPALGLYFPEAEGAVGNLSTNDSTAIQAAITAGRNGSTRPTVVLDGTYVADGLDVSGCHGLTLRGVPGKSILRHKTTGTAHLISANPTSATASADPADNLVGLTIEGLRIEGRTTGLDESYSVLNVSALTDALIQRNHFVGWKGDAIYLGCTNTAAVERHNLRVKILDNVFDGVNNANRNAVSVIEGDGVWIEDNTFLNCSDPTMPGAVCLEPNAAAWYVMRNMWVRNNRFENVTGNPGQVTIALHKQSDLTTPAQNFWVTDNTFVGGGNAVRVNVTDFSSVAADAETTVAPHYVTIRDNKMLGTGRPFQLFGVRGIDISGNVFDSCADTAMIGNLPTGSVADLKIKDNFFRRVSSGNATGGYVLTVFNGLRVTVKENDFDNCGRADGTQGVVLNLSTGGSTDTVSVRRNRIFGTRMTDAVKIGNSHTTTPASNDFTDNQDSTVNGCDTGFGRPWVGNADPCTVDYEATMTNATIGAVNDARYMRVKSSGLISKIALQIGTSSGNISVAVYQSNGSPGKLNRPGTRLATSGAVACPAVGYAEVSLGSSVQVREGDWLAISADNTTAAFYAANVSSGVASVLLDGRVYQQSTAHPLPSPVGTLSAQNNRVIALRGIR